MGRVAVRIGFPALGLLLLGFFLIRDRSEQTVKPESHSRVEVESTDSLPNESTAIGRWDFTRTLVYRFEVSGALTVEGPVETEKTPESAQFTLSGDLVLGPGKDSDGLLCQFRNISSKGSSGSADGGRESLEGKTARLSISDRGEIVSLQGEEQIRVFLSHLEFVLPEGDEGEWSQEGQDPAGSFVSTYRKLGFELESGRRVMKLEKRKEYVKDPSSNRGSAPLPDYFSTGTFDLKEKRMSLVEVTGTIPKSEGISMTGQVHFTFVFDHEETERIVANHSISSPKEKPSVSKRSQTNRPKITFADISPNLYSADPNTRARALLQLTHVPGAEARRVILEAIQDSDFRIRAAAAQALVTYRSEEKVMGHLMTMLTSDSNPLVRYRVAGSLKGSSFQEARDLLSVVAKEDSSKFVRKAANEALAYPIGGIDAH
ncbi:MAG: HEAT repeat domain-containing protein [Planctomycetota bacterium]|nr:HEAT repeat domain-containing protein [Planctomycetota bacterium]